MNILLLEDNAADSGLVVHALKKQMPGCEIEHATTLQKARKLLYGSQSFDVALLDMELPDGNGMDILVEIRQKQLDMAVVMFTGSGDEELATAALKAGADDYMVKQPGYVDKIPQLVEFAIENHNSIHRRESNCIHVLHIEHNAADVDLTNRHLARYAPCIIIKNVPTGEAALNILPAKNSKPEDWAFQVILMDYRLPGMTALEIIKEIRQERKLDIPIIIVTGHGNEEVAVQALKVGANEYLVKRENYLTRLPSLISGAYEHCELKRKQKALIESEAKYRLLAENSGDVIFTLDFDLKYTYISPAIQALRGFTPEETLHRNISEFMTPASHKIVKEIFERILPEIRRGIVSVKPIVVELETFKKDGTTIWVEVKVSLSTDSNGHPVGILGVSRDVSKRRAVEMELKKLLDDLVAAKEKAEESDRLKTAFINNISHEIRTPLNGILGFGQVLAESELPMRQREKMFKIVQQSSTRLLNTVSDYMNMARIVTGDMEVHKKEFLLQPLFEEITKDAKQLCLDNDIDFQVAISEKSSDLSLQSDPELLKIILAKLLDNAYKFTSQGSITCGYFWKPDNIEFFVSDTGSGIDRNKLEVIFQMFMQGDISMTSGYEGSGLGLTIAQALVTLLGGDMTVASEKDKGSTFTFTIPINDTLHFGTTKLSKSAEIRHDIQPLVLIAEDDELNYEYLAIVLDSIGYRHIHVADGAAAVDMCKQKPDISIVLMDIKMPVMNGVEATKLIRELRPELPIIAITAYAQIGDKHRFLEAGCSDYLAKPIKASDLSVMIERYSEAVAGDKS